MNIDTMEPHVPTAAAIKKKWAEIVDDMLDVRRNYWLNHSYFLGDQWIQWDDSAGRVDLAQSCCLPGSPKPLSSSSPAPKASTKTPSAKHHCNARCWKSKLTVPTGNRCGPTLC